MSRWVTYRNRWSSCEGCALCEKRKKVVLLRGSIPADVLMIGEAPGQSEDVIGQPFVGPAGKLLDAILQDAVEESGWNPRLAFTNTVACIPLVQNEDGTTSSKLSDPPAWAKEACQDRLTEVVDLIDPRAIVAVGKVASKWLQKVGLDEYGERFAAITHPAAILRAGLSQRGFAIQQATVIVSDLFTDLNGG